jgi:Domain of unknown function (DUF4352)
MANDTANRLVTPPLLRTGDILARCTTRRQSPVEAALIGGAAGGGGSGEQSPEEKYASAKEKAAPIGDTVTAGDVAWTVRSVQESTELKSLGQRKRGNFVIVDVIFKNNSDEAVTLDSSSLVILDDKGRESETDPDASMYVRRERPSHGQEPHRPRQDGDEA